MSHYRFEASRRIFSISHTVNVRLKSGKEDNDTTNIIFCPAPDILTGITVILTIGSEVMIK